MTGDVWDHYRHLLIGGRGYGKNTMLDKLAELHRKLEEQRQKQAELARMAGSALARPEPKPQIAGVRWVCKSPTEPVYAPGTNGWYAELAADVFAGRKTYAQVVAMASIEALRRK